MALICVTGPMGSGKSFYATRKAVEALERNKVVITNFKMAPEWTDRVANRHLVRWVIPGRRRQLRERFRRRVLVVKNLEDLMRVRVDGQGEGRAIAVIDEGHVFMNARDWRDDRRGEIVEWISATRKLGIDIYVITQDLQSVDRQVRDRLTYHVELRNLKQFKVAGIPVVPFNFFLAIWRYHTAGKTVVKREAYTLNWTKGLYFTDDLSSFARLDLPDEEVIRLPSPAPSAPPPPASAAATSAAGAAAPRRDALEASRRRLMEPDRFLRDDDVDAR